jgi:hypothetical protein
MATHEGYEVLEREPAEPGARTDEIRHRFELLDPGTGGRAMFPIHDYSRTTRVLRWNMFGEADVEVFRDFMDTRKGRLVPFWFPAMEYDLTPIDGFSTIVPTVRVTSIGYADHVFPIGPPRRHFYMQSRFTGASFFRKATAAVNNGDGTDTITLNSNPAANVSASVALMTYMRLCRLDQDVAEIHWTGGKRYQYADLRIIELPKGVP